MSSLDTSNISLPRKLKRTLVLTLLFAFAAAYVLALLLSALAWLGSGSSDALRVVAIWGGLLSLTTVFYRDVSEVKAYFTRGGLNTNSAMLMYLHHRGEGKNPLLIDLQSFQASDQILLLQLITQNAPHAHFNPLSEKVRQG